MLFETLLQDQIFFCTIYFGIICGIFLTVKNIIDNVFKKNKYVLIITDIIISIIFTALFLICINVFNYGQFRLFEVFGFMLGVIIEQISLNKIVEKFLKIIYNIFIKVFYKLKKTKIFQKIIK